MMAWSTRSVRSYPDSNPGEFAALIAAYVTGKKIVDQTAARAAVSEVTSSE